MRGYILIRPASNSANLKPAIPNPKSRHGKIPNPKSLGNPESEIPDPESLTLTQTPHLAPLLLNVTWKTQVLSPPTLSPRSPSTLAGATLPPLKPQTQNSTPSPKLRTPKPRNWKSPNLPIASIETSGICPQIKSLSVRVYQGGVSQYKWCKGGGFSVQSLRERGFLGTNCTREGSSRYNRYQ